MIIKIGQRQLIYYSDLTFGAAYDSVASMFTVSVFFDPDNADHKAMFRPGNTDVVTIEEDGVLLFTGYLQVPHFQDAADKELLSFSGYSKTGLLEDSDIPVSVYPLQTNNLSLKQITEKIINPFGLKLVVDSAVATDANAKIKQSAASDEQTARAYICELANQKHIILSHNEKGEVLLTRINTAQKPLFDFTTGMPGVRYELQVNGQAMHSSITVVKQASKAGKGNSGKTTISNPYGTLYKERVVRQTSGKDVDTKLAARNILSAELREIRLTITLDRWLLNKQMIKPNSLITVTNPELYLYNKTTFFIESINYFTDTAVQTATLNCVLPEVYNSATPKNIFS